MLLTRLDPPVYSKAYFNRDNKLSAHKHKLHGLLKKNEGEKVVKISRTVVIYSRYSKNNRCNSQSKQYLTNVTAQQEPANIFAKKYSYKTIRYK